MGMVVPSDQLTNVYIWAFDWEYTNPKVFENGLKMMVSEQYYRFENNKLGNAKTAGSGSYGNSKLIHDEALAKGFDDAIFLKSPSHNVAEASVANIIALDFYRKKAYSPIADHCFLNSITKQDALVLLEKNMGYEVVEKDFNVEFLKSMDGCVITGTASGVVPVKEIHNRGEVLSFDIGGDTLKVVNEYRAYVGWDLV
jgi:branched-subunit amino acid aminotransferase/4-amino-4-deoxychorismate lyase